MFGFQMSPTAHGELLSGASVLSVARNIRVGQFAENRSLFENTPMTHKLHKERTKIQKSKYLRLKQGIFEHSDLHSTVGSTITGVNHDFEGQFDLVHSGPGVGL